MHSISHRLQHFCSTFSAKTELIKCMKNRSKQQILQVDEIQQQQQKKKERTKERNDKTFAQQVLRAHFSDGLNYNVSNRLQMCLAALLILREHWRLHRKPNLIRFLQFVIIVSN